MNLFSRAARNENLLPNERALLKIVEGAIIAAVLAGVTAVLPILTTANGSTDWHQVITVGVTAMIIALIATTKKSFTAPADPPLAAPMAPVALGMPPPPSSPSSPSYATAPMAPDPPLGTLTLAHVTPPTDALPPAA